MFNYFWPDEDRKSSIGCQTRVVVTTSLSVWPDDSSKKYIIMSSNWIRYAFRFKSFK